MSPKTSFGSASSIISEPEPGTPSSRKKGHKGSQPSSPAPSSPQRASPRSGSRSKKSGSFRSITHEHELHSPHQSELGERTPSPADLGTLYVFVEGGARGTVRLGSVVQTQQHWQPIEIDRTALGACYTFCFFRICILALRWVTRSSLDLVPLHGRGASENGNGKSAHTCSLQQDSGTQ